MWLKLPVALHGILLHRPGPGNHGLVLTYTVSQQIPEYAFRMALGSSPFGVACLVARRGLIPVAAGLTCGFGLATGGTGFLRSMLFGVGPLDMVTFVGIGGLLLMSAFVACVAPAFRAARTEPATMLR